MGTRVLRVICVFGLGLICLSMGQAQQLAPQPLITQPVDQSQLSTLRGNVHPLARPQFDIGAAPPNLPMQRMLLVLKRAPQQDSALHKLLDDQQDKASPNYHKWLTPDQFGTQFGASDQDLQLITGWLQATGFQVNRVSNGRTFIEFSGVEAQVEQAFHTQIHQYLVNGEQHWANASEPQIPAALVPAVAGVLSLHNFPRKSMVQIYGKYSSRSKQLIPARPEFTFPGGCDPDGNCYAVAPADFGTIYNAKPLWNSGIDGTGQTIAIVGESDINIQDVRDFRSTFGLPPKDPKIIYDGPNPGMQPDEGEADIDVQWSGAIAPNATIDFVVSQSTETTQGIDLSAVYIIDNDLAPVMSESYGECELGLGTSGNQFYNSLWAQAAAQGITVILSSGDSGSSVCDQGSPQPAQFGLSVSGFASTPFNVAVGGTDFNDITNPQQYWNLSSTSATQESAKGYIPETTWNSTCTNSVVLGLLGWGTNAENNCNNPQLISQAPFLLLTEGGSGGVSNCTTSSSQNLSSCSGGYTKPPWQVAPGVPADSKRDLPDVSLFASNGFSGNFYIFCESDAFGSCNTFTFGAAGGTSFGAPAFAGIMALVNQQMQMPQGQGNANYVLYKLAGQQAASACNSTTGPGANCVFNDVTSGTIAMPCLAGSANCTVQTSGHAYGVLSGYGTGPGYDLATGLGTINVANLVNKWNTVVFRPTATTLTLSPTINITHGQAVTVNASVSPSTGSGTPSGNMSLLTSTGIGVDGFTLSGGAVSGTTNLLPGGSYTVAAHYAGDGTFGGSDSPPVNVTVGKENSSPHLELVTFDWQGRLISNNATTAVYGSPYILRVDVFNSLGSACRPNPLGGSGCPTGNLTLTDNSSPLDGGTFGLNSQGYTEDQTVQLPGGNDSVKAQYAGDSSFNPSSTTATMIITPAPTTMFSNLTGGNAGVNYSAPAFVQSQSSGVPPTGSVTFYVNGKAIPGTVTYSSFPAIGNPPTITYEANFTSSSSPFPTPGHYNITESYSGDANYQPASFNSGTLNAQFPAPAVTLQGSPNPVNAGSSTKLVATVLGASPTIAPTGTMGFSEVTIGNLFGPVSYSTITDPTTGNLDLQGTVTITPGFTDSYVADYSGDFNYQPSGFTSTIVTVNGNDFVLSAPGNSATVAPGGTGFYQLFIGFQSGTAPVSFTCSGLPSESACTASPNPISSIGTVYLQISTTASNRASAAKSSAHNSPYLWLSSITSFAAILLIGYRRSGTRRSLSRLLLTFLLLFSIACGGGSIGGGGGGGGGGGTPRAVTDLSATAMSSSQINLYWTPTSATSGATNYTVYRSTTSGFTPSSSNQIGAGVIPIPYSDTGLTPSTTYYYIVKAINSSGSSGPSNQASAATPAFDPGTPAGTYNITVTATSGSGASMVTHTTTLTLIVQ